VTRLCLRCSTCSNMVLAAMRWMKNEGFGNTHCHHHVVRGQHKVFAVSPAAHAEYGLLYCL
jgi:hypothetical protein